MEEYRVPFSSAESEFTEKRSRFLSHLWRVESEEEARQRIEETKRRHHDARHNCWCYLLRTGGVLRYSDDGEPQGTAGQPMLEVLRREEVTNVCCVVTRYFGGILLGAGGLTRAYARGAKDALDAAGIARMRLFAAVEVAAPYALYERVTRELAACGGGEPAAAFGAEVTVSALLPAERTKDFQARLTEISAGALAVRVLREVFCPGPREETQ